MGFRKISHQIRMRGFEIIQIFEQPIVFAVGDFRTVFDVIQVVTYLQRLAKPVELRKPVRMNQVAGTAKELR